MVPSVQPCSLELSVQPAYWPRLYMYNPAYWSCLYKTIHKGAVCMQPQPTGAVFSTLPTGAVCASMPDGSIYIYNPAYWSCLYNLSCLTFCIIPSLLEQSDKPCLLELILMEVVANNHFIWKGKEWMGALRKGKLIAGGYWVFGGLRSVKKIMLQ